MRKILYGLNYFWRLLGTGAAFAFVFIGGGLFAMTILKFLSIIFGQSNKRAQFFIHNAFRIYIYTLKNLGLINITIKGVEKLEKSAGKMIIANHPSLLDVVVLMSLIPRTQCIVKNQLWRHPFLGSVMREAGYIRNDQEPEKLIEECNSALAQGCCLIIFPEGTRTTPGARLNFQRGFANIATLTKVSIIPAVIICDPPTLIKGEPWWVIPANKPDYSVKIEETLDAQDYILYRHNSLNSRGLVKTMQQFYEDKLSNG